MTNKIDELRTRLENERKHLEGELEQVQAGVRSVEERREGSPFGKREETATDSFELEKQLAMEKRLRDSLAGVEHALRKMSEGTYGVCEVCGKPIEPARLEALPQATRHVDCKAKNAKG